MAGKKDWEIKKLRDIIKPQYGYTTSAKDSGNYRFIRITDIGDEGELRDSDKKYVTLRQNEAENYRLRRGDLLLARTGATFGKILHFEEDEPAIFASFLIRLSPNTSIIDPFYIWLFSRSQDYWQQARSLMTGSGQPQFNANKLKQIKIPMPPLKTQKQIVAKLSAVQDYKKQLLGQKAKLKELFDSALTKSMINK
jgi:restriction endonuclease S subunit